MSPLSILWAMAASCFWVIRLSLHVVPSRACMHAVPRQRHFPAILQLTYSCAISLTVLQFKIFTESVAAAERQ